MKKPYISVIIPTLNEQRNIGKVIDGVKQVLKDYNYEIILVDKHSADKTVEIAKAKGARILYEGLGKGYALRKGFKNARGKILISMDADLSNRPNELRLLISGIETGYDVCMGSRFLTGGGSEDMPRFRRLGNKAFVMLVNFFFKSHYTDLCYGYRSLTRSAAKRLKLTSTGFGIETELGIKAKKEGLKVLEVPSFEKKRVYGTGKLNSFHDGYVILKTIFANLF